MVISTIIAILSSMRHPCGVGQRTGNPGQQVHYGLAEAAVGFSPALWAMPLTPRWRHSGDAGTFWLPRGVGLRTDSRQLQVHHGRCRGQSGATRNSLGRPRGWASNGSGVLLMASIKCPHRWEGGRGQSGD